MAYDSFEFEGREIVAVNRAHRVPWDAPPDGLEYLWAVPDRPPSVDVGWRLAATARDGERLWYRLVTVPVPSSLWR